MDRADDKVYAYTASGQRDASADFDLDRSNGEAEGIAFANGRFHVVDWLDKKVYAYTASGQRDASADFGLDRSNFAWGGIAFANGRFYVVNDSRLGLPNKVYAYTASGQRDASADFDLGRGNYFPSGIAFANGRLYVVDWYRAKVYSYAASGDRSNGGTNPLPVSYTLLERWWLFPGGLVNFVALTISPGNCLNVNNSSLNGATYVVHSTKWQRRASAGSTWEDVPGTERQGRVCSYIATASGEYRMVGDITVGGRRGNYSSDTLTVP